MYATSIFLLMETHLCAKAAKAFLWVMSLFFVDLVMGTVFSKTLSTHRRALRWAGVHFAKRLRNSWFFLNRCAIATEVQSRDSVFYTFLK